MPDEGSKHGLDFGPDPVMGDLVRLQERIFLGHGQMSRTTALVEHTDCHAVSEILSRVGDKWTVLIVVALREEPQRFSALKRTVGGISQQMLALTLKTLERDGMILRTVRATTPPQVSYELTDLGRSLADTLKLLAGWAVGNRVAIEESRRRYDRRGPASLP